MAVVITPVSAADARGRRQPGGQKGAAHCLCRPGEKRVHLRRSNVDVFQHGLGARAAGTAEPAEDLLIPRLPTFALSSPLWDTGPGAILRHLQVVAGTMTSQAGSGSRRSSRREAQCRLEAAACRVAASPGDQMLPDTRTPSTHAGSSVKA